MTKIRTTYNPKEILNLLRRAKLYSLPVEVWKAGGKTKRAYKGLFTKVTEDKIYFGLENPADKENIQFEGDFEYYFQLEFQKIIFKRRKLIDEEKGFSFKTPGEMGVLERRESKRYKYLYNDHKEFKFYFKDESKSPLSEEGESPITFSANVLDISIYGICIVVPLSLQSNFIRFEDHCVVVIDSLSDHPEIKGERAKVVYNIPYKIIEKSSDELFRVGVEFENPLKEINYQSVNESQKQKLERVKQAAREAFKMGIKTFHGLTLGEQEAIILDVHQRDQNFAKTISENIEFIEQLKFLTPTMKQSLLRDIPFSNLAAALRLSSKDLIVNLIKGTTETIQRELLFYLEEPRLLGMIQKNQQQIIDYIRKKEKEGVIYLDEESFGKYV